MALRRVVLALVLIAVVAAACAESAPDSSITLDEPIGAPDNTSDFVESSEASTTDADTSVIKTASVELEVARDELTSAAQSIVDLASKTGGFLVSSVLDTSDGDGSANVVVRVPTSSFETVVGDLSSIGDVQRQVLEGNNLTPAAMRTRARLQRAREHLASVRARLEGSENEAEKMQLRNELTTGRSQVANLEEQQIDIDAQTSFGTIETSLKGTPPAAPPEKPAFERALATAKSIAIGIGSAAVLTAGVVVPIAALFLLLYPLALMLVRRLKPRFSAGGTPTISESLDL